MIDPTHSVARPWDQPKTTARRDESRPRHLPADRSGGARRGRADAERVAKANLFMYNAYMNDKPRAAAGLFPLLHAAGVVQAHLESKLDAVDLSLAKLAALSALADAGESLPLGQLAGRLSCVKSNITQLVDRLEADG